MGNESLTSKRVAALIEQLGRCAYGGAFAAGLNPAQWSALRYFHRANRFSCTVGAFARYHGTTMGTASQTVKALVEKGYLRRGTHPGDRRSARLEPTEAAVALLERDPLQILVDAASGLPPAQRGMLLEGLEGMLGRLHAMSGRPLFGVCADCRHLLTDPCCGAGAHHHCTLMGEPIATPETDRVCVNHQPPLS